MPLCISGASKNIKFLIQKPLCVSVPIAHELSPAYACQDNAYAVMAPILSPRSSRFGPEISSNLNFGFNLNVSRDSDGDATRKRTSCSISFSAAPILSSNCLRKPCYICFMGRLYPNTLMLKRDDGASRYSASSFLCFSEPRNQPYDIINRCTTTRRIINPCILYYSLLEATLSSNSF